MKEAAGINQSSGAISRQQSAETCSESPRNPRYTVPLGAAIQSIDLVISQGRMDGHGSCGLILLLDKNTHPGGPSATVPKEKRDSHVLLMLQRLAQASPSCTLGSLGAEECYFIENYLTAYQGS